MHRDLVEQRGWFSDDEYRQGLALAQTMPGPLAAQLAMWMGFLTRGIVGSAAVAAALAFGLGGRDAAARILERWPDTGPPPRPAPPRRIRGNPTDEQPPLV